MPGRHRGAPIRRPARRWIAGAVGAGLISAVLLALIPATAGAAGDPVTATFSVTGVSTSGCPVSAGGSDVYVKPGQELDVSSSLTGIRLLGLNLSLGDYRGKLVIDPGSSKPITRLTGTTPKALPDLSPGDHGFSWTVTDLSGVPLSTTLAAVGAGASLHYSGKIHVTDGTTKCGIAVQVPSASASLPGLPGLPPVKVPIPGVKVTVAPSLPNLPHLPGGGTGGPTTAAAGGSHSSADNRLPVPARVVPTGDGDAVYGNVGGGYLPGVLPNAADNAGGSANVLPVSADGTAKPAAAAVQQSTGKHKTIDLAASKANPTGQFSVILAIVAVLALSLVAATYARLYLLRRETPTS